MIIVDSSGSMGVASLATAKEAIKTVIQMLGLNDHVVSSPRGVQRAGPAGMSVMFTFLLAAVHGVFVCVRAAGCVLACLLARFPVECTLVCIVTRQIAFILYPVDGADGADV